MFGRKATHRDQMLFVLVKSRKHWWKRHSLNTDSRAEYSQLEVQEAKISKSSTM